MVAAYTFDCLTLDLTSIVVARIGVASQIDDARTDIRVAVLVIILGFKMIALYTFRAVVAGMILSAGTLTCFKITVAETAARIRTALNTVRKFRIFSIIRLREDVP